MIRLNVVVEGQTEEAYANRVLVPHFSAMEIFPSIQLISSKTSTTSRAFKGGFNSYGAVKEHLVRWMKADAGENVWFTTMLDLYALPQDFPGFAEATQLPDARARVECLEERFEADMAQTGLRRFVPHLQLHEFEALLFVNPAALDWEFLEHEAAIGRLLRVAGEFASPEDIDDGPQTAPSKRIIQEIPEYEHRKASVGPLVADKIGLEESRRRCPHFNQWICRIEALAR